MFDSITSAPITKAIILVSVSMSILTYFNVVPIHYLSFSPKMIFEYGQYWRFLSSPFYFGDFKISLILSLYNIAQFSSTVESGIFTGRPENFLIFLMFGILCFYFLSPIFHIVFIGQLLVPYITYYWSKHFGDQKIQMFSLPIPIQAQYLPMVTLAINYIENGKIALVTNFIAYAIGHVYFFVHDVVGVKYGKPMLSAPKWVSAVFKSIKF